MDTLLVARGQAASPQEAQRLIMAGRVRVGEHVVDKPGTQISVTAQVAVAGSRPYVSRGGLKLAAALDAFALDVASRVAADVGASTGGFTDCLLQRGAARVYAIDVGYGQLSWKLRQDSRVVVMDRTNARHLKDLPEPVDLATIDVSFISLKLILPAVLGWLRPRGQIVALIKPQFEARREQVASGGVVLDPAVHRAVLDDLVDWAAGQGLALRGLTRSPIRGPAGNIEFLAHWSPGAADRDTTQTLVHACLNAKGGDSHDQDASR